MSPDPTEIQKLFQEYYILNVGQFANALAHREKAEPQVEQILIDGGYKWDEHNRLYINKNLGNIFALPNGMFIWTTANFGKVLKNTDKLSIWVNTRNREFLARFRALFDQDDLKIGKGDRPKPYNPAPIEKGDETDQEIAQLKRQAGVKKTLPSDLMITLGLQAKKEKNQKMLDFLKTITPMNEGTMKRSQLDALVREIIKGIIKEAGMSSYSAGGDEGDDEEGERGDKTAIRVATNAWGNRMWRVQTSRNSPQGEVWKLAYDQRMTRFVWRTPQGQWKALDPKTKKWMDISLGMKEMTGTAAVSPISTPNAFSKKKPMDEMTTTGDVSGYNVPSAFSKKGGSHRGVAGSAALGYTLTPQGEKEMNRKADRLNEQ